jgi:hypothetical protein
MADIVGIVHDVLAGTLPGPAARRRLEALQPAEACNGFWHGRPGLDDAAA